ncbi:MAG: 3-phosphoshikimate 1-carboxyvinyltransferase [Firmicutes bacterium]|nr:3-phosphoshikimate 1-carboxyvinyltransferase [Bacillota bacterium]
MQITIAAQGALKGEVRLPGDKSISHRAALLGALAEGETEIKGFLLGKDCLATLTCLRQLGVTITQQGSTVKIKGVGLQGLKEPETILDCGNSGTTARLLCGILAGQPFFSVLTGDESLRRRPMGRVIKPLMEMGAQIRGRRGGDLLPLAITGGPLQAKRIQTPVASAQLKSAILLAGLFAEGKTVITEPEPSRDHTERMLAAFGAEITTANSTISIKGQPMLAGCQIQIPGDISSAAYFIVAASITPGSELYLPNVGVNPTRTGLLDVLQMMGAKITLENRRVINGEPIADLYVQSSELKGVEFGGKLIPRLIDEIPIIAVAALFAQGRTIIKDAAELRLKETDRLTAITEEFAKLGAKVISTADGLIIDGGQKLEGGIAHSRGDHRIAMSLAIAALRAQNPVTIKDAACVEISYPQFWTTLNKLQQAK